VAGGFDFTKQRLGLRNARTLIVPSHFDLREAALLYVPQTLPASSQSRVYRAAAREIIEILTSSRGRAFVLFTSYQQYAADLRSRLARNSLADAAQAPAAQRAARGFRSTPNSVLFATASFLAGVDVPANN